MSVTEEEGGRLNAFAKEPKIEVINENSINNKGLQLLIALGALLLLGLITFSLTNS